MNSKGHLYISLIKSIIRILGCVLSLLFNNFTILAVVFGIAEILGIFEEVVDKR